MTEKFKRQVKVILTEYRDQSYRAMQHRQALEIGDYNPIYEGIARSCEEDAKEARATLIEKLKQVLPDSHAEETADSMCLEIDENSPY